MSIDVFIRNVKIEAKAQSTAFPATYPITITSIPSTTQFQFTPAVAVAISSGTTLPIFGQITSAQQYNNLPDTIIRNIFRVNQALASINGDRLVSIGTRLWRALLPAGNAFEELIAPLTPSGAAPSAANTLDGRTLSIIEFRFTLDSTAWAIIANSLGMYKYRTAATLQGIEFVPLGNAPPTVAAPASAGGAGNLNSSGGTGYDWRYTYVDGLALTESNPSPINQTTGMTTVTPSTHGGFASSNIAGSDTISLTNPSPSGSASQTDTATWGNFAIPAGIITSQTLNVTLSASGGATSMFNSNASGGVDVLYSYDAGATWHAVYSAGVSAANGSSDSFSAASQTYSVTIPSSISPANLQVQATVSGFVDGSITPIIAIAQVNISFAITNITLSVAFQSAVNGLSLTNQSANVCVTPSPYAQHTFINLYRRGGSLTDAWRLVGQFQASTLVQGGCGAGTLQINDNVSDTTLSTAAILQLDNDQPITSVTKTNQPLSFIWGPVGTDARVLGCGDPARPESVYFSKPGNADAWPPQNHIEVAEPGTPVIAGCAFNTRNFAFTRESIYELVEGLGNGATYTPFRTPSARGLYSPWGLAVGASVYFIAKDGIYETTGGQETSLVENDIKPLFPTYDSPGRSVEGYEAVDYTQPDFLRLRYHNNELYFIYIGATSQTFQMLVFDTYKRRWRAADSTSGASEVYSEPATTSSLLVGTAAGGVYQAGGPSDPTELNLLRGVNVTTVTVASSAFPSTTYAARISALSIDGEVAISYNFDGLVMSATTGLSVTLPNAELGVIGWRVYFGPTGSLETQYVAFTEAQVAATPNRNLVITTIGTSGTPPTVNASHNIHVDIRTGAHDQGAPLNKKQYGNVIFDLDPGGATQAYPVTITPYVNGEAQAQAALTVTGLGRQQVPLSLSDYFAFNTEYAITWQRALQNGAYTNPVLFQYDTLHFLEPAELTHWRSQASAFGFPGWLHCRDAYIAIRSNVATTLSVTFDTGTGTETTQTYTIPSTNGQRLKQYIQFAPNKGLLYRFTLDTNAPGSFRLYEADLEVRVKPWLGILGYSIQRPLGGESA